jgi:hypothetical protein
MGRSLARLDESLISRAIRHVQGNHTIHVRGTQLKTWGRGEKQQWHAGQQPADAAANLIAIFAPLSCYYCILDVAARGGEGGTSPGGIG